MDSLDPLTTATIVFLIIKCIAWLGSREMSCPICDYAGAPQPKQSILTELGLIGTCFLITIFAQQGVPMFLLTTVGLFLYFGLHHSPQICPRCQWDGRSIRATSLR